MTALTLTEQKKIKFALINPDYKLYGDPPLGLACLAAYLKRECKFLRIKIFDQVREEKILESLVKTKPEVIGISAVSQNYYKAVKLGKIIKKILPNSVLVLGGVHITTLPESFKNSPFDIAIRGEGEIPVKKFFEIFYKDIKINVKKLSKIPGFMLRNKDKIIDTGLSETMTDLDDVPLPAREMLNMKYYQLPRFSSKKLDANGAILTSRGCPFACRFCASSLFWNRKIRFFSAKRVVEELEVLHYKYRYTNIEIYDDLFSINKERLREIVRLLNESSLAGKIKFSVMARANTFDEETASLFKQMGVYSLAFGFETGSQKILTYLKRDGVTIEMAVNAVKIAKRHGLLIHGFFMTGAPYETREDMEMTYKFIKENNLDSAQILQVTPYPGTEIWQYAVENNIVPRDFYEKPAKELPEINLNLLLSKEISKEDFIEGFHKIQGAINQNKERGFLTKIFAIRPRHIKAMLSKEFFEKVNSIKGHFLRDVLFR